MVTLMRPDGQGDMVTLIRPDRQGDMVMQIRALRWGCATEQYVCIDHVCAAMLFVETRCSDERRMDMLFLRLMEYSKVILLKAK
jgi:hypothetical protein